jgi:2-polyprenyl-6-methoxyphenol hydroxylase-like FAD-dependent oxidoreductase
VTSDAGRVIAADVAIVGAGPTGLLLACQLRQAGVSVAVVERLASPMTESRASQLTTLTARTLHEQGFDELLAEAVAEPRAHFAGLPFDLSGLGGPYAGNWKLPQYRTEAILGRRARETGARLLRSRELTGVTQGRDHVLCRVDGPDGNERIRARYLVGCDGARSTVRALCGFTATTTAPTRELLRADVTGIAVPGRRFERLERGFAVAGTSDNGVTRVMVHAFGQAPVRRPGSPRFAEVAAAWRQVTSENIAGGTPVWVDAFDNSWGQADCYRQGRVLLAGDAAHWHLPIGGQALNVGLQDAVNLGWKLAGAVRGWAAPGLLDTYHAERHPVAARVLRHVAAQEALLLGDHEIDPVREVLAEIVRLDRVRQHLALTASGLADRYGPPDAPLAGHRLADVGLGDREEAPGITALLRGGRPFIAWLSTPGRALMEPARLPASIPSTVVRVSPDWAARFPGAAAILARPDGYIAWSGNVGAELVKALREWTAARSGSVKLSHQPEGAS